MDRLLDEILRAELKVERVLQEAREQAAHTKQQAEIEASQKIEEARHKAKQIISNHIEAEKKKATQIRDKKLKIAEEESIAFLASNKLIIHNLVQEILGLIVQTVHEEKGSE